jgi:NAD(P)-dependent dehydrogenase (short-subunit alcohol dehydrogenase family)
MKILVIGATGTIGRPVSEALAARHEVVRASRRGTTHVDLLEPRTIDDALAARDVDAVVCCAGGARWKPLDQLTDEDFAASLRDKLMGQVDVVRHALRAIRDGGSITVTSGVLAQHPMVGSAAVSLVNAGLEGFVRNAALEAPRGIRVNVVSPPWVSETLAAMKMDPAQGLPAAQVARAYVAAVEGTMRGATIDPRAL